jgi:mono/diheme cytochrome c family protein
MRSPFFLFALLVAVGCSSAPPPTAPAAPVAVDRADMRAHFARATAARDALLDGDVEAMKQHARWLADHGDDPGAKVRGPVHFDRMKGAAQAVDEAHTLGTAARALAELAGACGACHQAADARFEAPKPLLPPMKDELQAHMARHRWAVEQMWAGLVTPSEAAWARGAQSLSEAPLHAVDFALEGLDAKLVPRAATLHGLAAAAAAAPAAERGDHFARIIATCGGCHRHRPRPDR